MPQPQMPDEALTQIYPILPLVMVNSTPVIESVIRIAVLNPATQPTRGQVGA